MRALCFATVAAHRIERDSEQPANNRTMKKKKQTKIKIKTQTNDKTNILKRERRKNECRNGRKKRERYVTKINNKLCSACLLSCLNSHFVRNR